MCIEFNAKLFNVKYVQYIYVCTMYRLYYKTILHAYLEKEIPSQSVFVYKLYIRY